MWRGTMQGARSLEFAEAAAGREGYVIEAAPGHPGCWRSPCPGRGRTPHARMMAGSAHLSPLIAVTRDGGEGRVSLTKAGRVRLDYRLDATGVATLRHALVSMARTSPGRPAPPRSSPRGRRRPGIHPTGGGRRPRMLGRSPRFEEALAAFDFGPNRGAVFSAHQMGSVRMGADAGDASVRPMGSGPTRPPRATP